MKSDYCPHCYPTKRKYHKMLYWDYYFTKFFNLVNFPVKLLPQNSDFYHLVWKYFLKGLLFFKIATLDSGPDEKQFFNRSLIFFNEAKKRGIDIWAIKVFGKYNNEFRFKYNNKFYFYEEIPLTLKQNAYHLDDKIRIKNILNKNKEPVAAGKIFTNSQKAYNFGQTIGFPLVVKPNSGSLSHHVTCNITDQQQLKKAIQVAKQYRPDFIVEQYIDGNLYRACVIGQKQVFCCQKDKANVITDGISTIKQLIEQKNNNIKRGQTLTKNTTLHIIPIDDVLIKNLSIQGLDLETVLPENKKVYLQDKYVLSHGCDIINCDNDIHPDNLELFRRISQLLNVNLIGIDFICPDISISYKNQKTAVLETNSLPYIDMHQNPSHGLPVDVAKISWDYILQTIS